METCGKKAAMSSNDQKWQKLIRNKQITHFDQRPEQLLNKKSSKSKKQLNIGNDNNLYQLQQSKVSDQNIVIIKQQLFDDHHLTKTTQQKTYESKPTQIQAKNMSQDAIFNKSDNSKIIYQHYELLFLLKKKFKSIIQKKGDNLKELPYQLIDLTLYPNLQKLINKVQTNQTLIVPKFYNQTLDQIKRLLNEYADQQLKSMVQEERRHYQYVTDHNKKLVQMRSSILKGFKSTITIKDTYMADILSTIFKLNNSYDKYYGKQALAVIPPKTLSTLFSLEKYELQYFSQRYKKIDKQLLYYIPYLLRLQQIIILLSFLEIKSKISNRMAKGKTNIDIKNHEIFLQNKYRQLNEIELLQDQIDDSERIQYHFSEIMFLSVKEKKLTDSKPYRQLQIIEQLSKALQLGSQRQQYSKIIQIHFTYSIALKQLIDQFKKIQDGNTSGETPSQLPSFEEQIRTCQWSNVKHNSTRKFLYNLTGKYFMESSQFQKSGYSDLLKFYFNTMIKRFKTVLKSFLILHKIEEKILEKKNIYVRKFQYQIKNSRKQSNEQKEMTYTLILAVFNNKLLYSCLIKKKIDDFQYLALLRHRLSKHINKIGKVNLVLGELRINNHFMFRPFKCLSDYYKRYFDSHVYVAYSPELFEIHIIIDAFLTDYIIQRNDHQEIFNALIFFEQLQTQIPIQRKKSIKIINFKEKFQQRLIKVAQQCNLIKAEQNYSTDEIIKKMNMLCIKIPDIYSMLRDAARTLLVFQVYFKEIVYIAEKIGKLGDLKTHFSKDCRFLNELFQSENKEIDSLFPHERTEITARLINLDIFKGNSSSDVIYSPFSEQIAEKIDINDINQKTAEQDKNSQSNEKVIFSKQVQDNIINESSNLFPIIQIKIGKIEQIRSKIMSKMLESDNKHKQHAKIVQNILETRHSLHFYQCWHLNSQKGRD